MSVFVFATILGDAVVIIISAVAKSGFGFVEFVDTSYVMLVIPALSLPPFFCYCSGC